MLLGPTAARAQDDAPMIFAWIALEPGPERPDLLAITANAAALGPFEGRYVLTVSRKNGGNTSNSSQRGKINVTESGAATLSRTVINVSPTDELRLTLEIMPAEAETVISRAEVSFP